MNVSKSRIAVAVVLLLAISTPIHAAAPKAGAKCTKAGSTATAGGKKFTCVKSGTKLVWNKGVAIQAAAPKPSATPNTTVTSTPTPKPTPTPTQINFVPWGTDLDSKTLSDIAQRNFQQWVKERSGQPKNHTTYSGK